ncbi:TPMT family class I SAM-dependent methyltransferase [Zhouia spongiae]|uniref:TPMT family class I SAM-dependent methyltransferase n=1 Tax=Zhouia spongiae TaxID=2202721 RepID=A0ABY3YII4_9FLAO|nr:methyltransferase [Zhouia spongiae]UNY97434.1 TPMT family class I SAM-dependent methyltransferase [Zhouia spongiae]
MKLNKDYWENRYQTKATQWDIGYISTPLQTYIDQLTDKNLSILIPGAGNGYEAEYLLNKGFKNVYVVDIAETPLQNIQKRVKKIRSEQLICIDFFDLDLKFDLVLEQTFFCALAPEYRKSYARKMHELLTPEGKIAGLLFAFPLTGDGPPFGGSEKEYRTVFSPYFKIKTLETCFNSVKPRLGNELFFIFEKK